MADTAPLVRTRTDEAFLSPGEGYDIDFFPVGGPALAWAYRGAAKDVFLLQKPGGPSVPAREALREVAASRRSGRRGKVFLLRPPVGGLRPTFENILLDPSLSGGSQPGDINVPPGVIKGGVRIEVFQPGSTKPKVTLDTKDISTGGPPEDLGDNNLTFSVTKAFAEKKWRCRFTNISDEDSVVIGHVQFVHRAANLVTTRIPTRLLNRTLRQFLISLGLQVFAHRGVGLISVNEEIEHLTDGAIKDTDFTFPDAPPFFEAKGIEMEDLSVTAGQDSKTGLPAFVIAATFTGDVEASILGIGFELTKLELKLNFFLFSSTPFPDLVGNSVFPIVTASAKIEGTENVPGLGIGDIEDSVEDALESFFQDQSIRSAAVKYLTAGLLALAQENHLLWDLTADPNNFIVRHFRPPGPFDGVGQPLAPVDDVFVEARTLRSGPAAGGTSGPSPGSRGRARRRAGRPVKDDPTVANLDKIEHVIVLMMENRSFDHMLGYLRARGGRTDVDGLTGSETNVNPKTGKAVAVEELSRSLFKFGPHHDHSNVLAQVNDGKMDGFLANFLTRFKDVNPKFGMGFYTDETLPVYQRLVDQFTICDRWFCSHPGPTMPNRLCTLTGGTPILDNLSLDDPRVGYLDTPTLFDFLTAGGITWAYHEQDIGFVRLFDRYRLENERVLPFSKDDGARGYRDEEIFLNRLATGQLPQVTFVDPDFVDIPPDRTANDDHPPADVANGQALVRRIYNALIRSPAWAKTLFVITYDEHGGFFDHVPPPGSKFAPGEEEIPKVNDDGPGFYGVRVPTFVISPWVPAGTVDSTRFDHTSIGKTILLRFARGIIPKAFGERLERANHLGGLLTNTSPRLKLPLIPTVDLPPASLIPAKENEKPRTEYQEIMKRFAIPRVR